MQSRRSSLIEAGVNILIGYSINFTANLVILPLYGFHISYGANFTMGCLYTVISLVRSYTIRRYFNGMIHRAALKMAHERSNQ